jgi:predicted metalloprotease with PDZ domain
MTMKTLALTLALLLPAWHASAAAYDGAPNRYRVSVNADATRAHVEADVWVEGNELALFGVDPIAQFKNGQADFLEKITVRDTAGQPIALTDKGEGEYLIAGERRVALSYDVRLEHGNYKWPAGAEEVSYRTDEGLMATGNVLFLVPGVKMNGPTEIEFQLPAHWQAYTPWRASGAPNTFVARTRRELVNNALFLGTARAERFKAGGVELTLVMGKRYWPQRAVFMDLIERQLASYQALFGKGPLAERYLIVINQNESGDGGAFAGSFSQFLRGRGERATRPIWGRVVAHELLHFWNGVSMAPSSDQQEWFKEGVTDYLTVMTMARNGLVDRHYLMQWLENLGRGQMVARMGLGLTGTVQEAARDKHRNWLLVYGGGSVAALAMDVELRQASAGKAGLPELMKAMYAQYGAAGKTYTLDDIVRVAKEVSGHDVAPLLGRIVQSDTMPDQRATFAALGLRLEQYPLLETFLLPDPNATPAARLRFTQIFGAAPGK